MTTAYRYRHTSTTSASTDVVVRERSGLLLIEPKRSYMLAGRSPERSRHALTIRYEFPGTHGSIAEVSSSVLATRYARGHITEDLFLIKPLKLKVQWYDDLCIVSDEIFAIYGEGDTEIGAIQDYKVSLAEYYDIITADNANNVLVDLLKEYITKA